MSDDMLEMNNATQQKLKMQAEEMGIKMKDAQITWNDKDGYSIRGYKKRTIKDAVDKGIKDGTLSERAMARRERMDEMSGFGKIKK